MSYKIIVFSDSHGIKGYMKKALSLHNDIDAIIHLGDGAQDIITLVDTEYTDNRPKLICVKGNGEEWAGSGYVTATSALKRTMVTEIENQKIFICHGHMENVKSGATQLMTTASSENADIALFGHTHEKVNLYFPEDKVREITGNADAKALYLFNPGSISLPKGLAKRSYGIIELTDKGVLLSHGEI